MSWSCPHEDKEFCKKRRRGCRPLSKGCVLEGKGLEIVGHGDSIGATSQTHDGIRKRRKTR